MQVIGKMLLPLLFFSPLVTVGMIYWSTLEDTKILETLWKPALFTFLLFWVWLSSGQCLRKATETVSDE
jgi:hypothetical protein